MRVIVVLALYLLTVALAGALLCPPIWWGFQWLVEQGMMPEFLADTPFRRLADRVFMLLGLGLLWPMLRALKMRGRENWGLGVQMRRVPPMIGLGLGYGIATMSLLFIVLWSLGIVVGDWGGWGDLADAIVGGLIKGLVIAMIEECFFRGAVYSSCERDFGPRFAIGFTAIFYSVVHFIRARMEFETVTWTSGFELIGDALSAFSHPGIIGPILTLVVVGVYLGQLRLALGHAMAGVGIHAGWVMMIEVGRELSDTVDTTPLYWLAPTRRNGGYDGVTGYLAAFYLGLWTLHLAWVLRKRAQTRRDAAASDPLAPTTKEAGA